jgi:Putative prokaryotic signal transducing protein
MNYITLRSYDNYIPAHIAMARLENEGINCYLKDEFTVTIDPILSNAVGGIKLCVHPAQIERATDLFHLMEEQTKQMQACPACNSQNVQYITQPGKAVNWFAALISWFVASYAVDVKKVYHCFNCGNEFHELSEK